MVDLNYLINAFTKDKKIILLKPQYYLTQEN